MAELILFHTLPRHKDLFCCGLPPPLLFIISSHSINIAILFLVVRLCVGLAPSLGASLLCRPNRPIVFPLIRQQKQFPPLYSVSASIVDQPFRLELTRRESS